MARKVIIPEHLPQTMGPYSHCVVGEGSKLVFISGQVPQDANGRLVGRGDIAAQARQVLANIRIAVEAAGGTVQDINKITIFLVELDPAAYAAVAQARRILKVYPNSQASSNAHQLLERYGVDTGGGVTEEQQ